MVCNRGLSVQFYNMSSIYFIVFHAICYKIICLEAFPKTLTDHLSQQNKTAIMQVVSKSHNFKDQSHN